MNANQAVKLFEEFNGFSPDRVAVATVTRVPRGMPRNWVRIGNTDEIKSGRKLLKFPRGTALYAARSKKGKAVLAIAGPLIRSASGHGKITSIVYRAKSKRYEMLRLKDKGRPFMHFFGLGVMGKGVKVTQGKREIPMVLVQGGKLSIDKRGILN